MFRVYESRENIPDPNDVSDALITGVKDEVSVLHVLISCCRLTIFSLPIANYSLWSGLPGELDPPGHRGQPRGLAPAAGLHLRLGLGGLQEDPGAGLQEQVEGQTSQL